ncbi:cytoskeleton-associated protein 2-like isoform X2 [Xyrauchen texanus]|uniref:cytoskeleton-associated protein 2-like isoform X2 n=1 Tax=Xyrauchen texanus TaxID=154827 RepID=UPI0022425F4D|nr:cytoskeleton-associated protein 2-like isoform X2 [Xyrauchen texanus]
MEQVSNKENTKPRCGPKNQVINSIVSKRNVLSKSAPLQSKYDLKEGNSGKSMKDKDVRPMDRTNDADPAKLSTLSQAFRTQQSVRHRKLVEEVNKTPSTVLQKSKPGIYKGRVVQSKIDCFRKPSGDVKITEKRVISKPDLTSPKTKLPKIRSKSVTALPVSTRPGLKSALSSRPKSVSDVLLHVTEKSVQMTVSQKHIPLKVPGSISQAVTHRACIPPRPVPLATGRSPVSKPIPSKKKETVVPRAKPKAVVITTEQKVKRPIASKISQYRVQMETAEERRAKLAEWLASKGKALKRPPISERSATHSVKPALQPKTGPKATVIAQSDPVTQTEALKPTPEIKMDIQSEDNKVLDDKEVHTSRSSNIMNTTLDLLDNSDMDLPIDPEIRMESLVLNLCDKLEAMETPSSCKDEKKMEVQVEEEETDKLYEILEDEELEEKEDSDCDITEDTKEAVVKDDDVNSEDEISSTPPEMECASIVKYNVKTTPYLQSVKKKIDCETAPGSGSRCKSTIKDLKFLTPVRRSTRIQRNSSRLPNMLNEHDTCVSSLAELVQLEDADASAYIYRKNTALLEDLPDQPEDLVKGCC